MSGTATVTPIRRTPAVATYLSPEDVCSKVPGMTVRTLADLRKTGKGPAYFKPTGDRGKVVVYAEADVDEWVRRSRHTTTEQS